MHKPGFRALASSAHGSTYHASDAYGNRYYIARGTASSVHASSPRAEEGYLDVMDKI